MPVGAGPGAVPLPGRVGPNTPGVASAVSIAAARGESDDDGLDARTIANTSKLLPTTRPACQSQTAVGFLGVFAFERSGCLYIGDGRSIEGKYGDRFEMRTSNLTASADGCNHFCRSRRR